MLNCNISWEVLTFIDLNYCIVDSLYNPIINLFFIGSKECSTCTTSGFKARVGYRIRGSRLNHELNDSIYSFEPDYPVFIEILSDI